MIFTRWGNKITITGGDIGKDIIHIKYTDGSEECVRVMDLKADGGIAEIAKSINERVYRPI